MKAHPALTEQHEAFRQDDSGGAEEIMKDLAARQQDW